MTRTDGSLSVRQQTILDFITDRIRSGMLAPTVREIVDYVGDKSPTSVHRHLRTLERRGYILRDATKSRGIRLPVWMTELAVTGIVTPGKPIEPVEPAGRIDAGQLFDPPSHFTLRCQGDSLNDDFIIDGDLIAVQRQDDFEQNDLCVARQAGQTAIVGRMTSEGDSIRVQSGATETLIQRDDLELLGVVAGVIRQTIQASDAHAAA